jgi:hypothetical protein
MSALASRGLSEYDRARQFLVAVLEDGEMPAGLVAQHAQRAGISPKTLSRARASLRCEGRIEREKRPSGWVWSLAGVWSKAASAGPIEYGANEMLQAIQDWTTAFGEPPSMLDWHLGMAEARNEAWRITRYRSTNRTWPKVDAVRTEFGSWRNALVSAGLS